MLRGMELEGLSVGRTRHGDGSDRPADMRVAAVAARQQGRVTTAQLTAAGLSEDAVRRRVEAGRLHREHRGVYAVGHPGATDDARHMAATLACGPWALLSGRSLAHHLDLFHGPAPAVVDVTVAGRTRSGVPGIRLHLPRRIGRDETTTVRFVPCVTPERLLVDSAAEVDDAELATLVHRAHVRGLVHEERMARQLLRRVDGVGRVRELIEPTGPDLREQLEKRLHAFVRRGGWPAYEPNVRVGTPLGELRADALWREHGFALELDSWRHHSDRDHFESDRRRVVAADLVGIQLTRITWRMLVGTPEVVEALLDHRLGRPNPSR